MSSFLFIAIAAVLAFLIAWLVNIVVGVLSGERPGDTGRQFADIFLRVLGFVRFGGSSYYLDRLGFPRWTRWIIYAGGLLFIISAIISLLTSSDSRFDRSNMYTWTNPPAGWPYSNQVQRP